MIHPIYALLAVATLILAVLGGLVSPWLDDNARHQSIFTLIILFVIIVLGSCMGMGIIPATLR